MRTIILTTIATLGLALACIPQSAPVSHATPAVTTGYSPAHVAQPGSRGSVVDI